MKFYGTLKVYRYEDNWNPEITEIFAEHFEAKSIQSAKAKLTKISNETELFSWIQSWDNEKRTYTGKDLRWQSWCEIHTAMTVSDQEVARTSRMSLRESAGIVKDPDDPDYKYGRSVGYRVDITLRWLVSGKEEKT